MKTLQDLKLELDDYLTQNKEILEKIQNLRQEIAEKDCPLKIGDDVTIEDLNGKIVTIKIDSIDYTQDLAHHSLNIPGQDSSWIVSGHKYNKTSGELSHSHRASANPWAYDYAGTHFKAVPFGSIRFGWGFI